MASVAGDSEGTVPPLFVYIMYFIHALPFTNSAINWILYGALNGQLQQRYRRTRSTKSTCATKLVVPSTVKAPAMNGSATFLNQPTEQQLSTADDSEMVDVRLLAAHEPTHL
ncbi:unnamed protein product [Nippostrongylus brasiliensis]|uniref:G_PROTEIN_RECEP_F1_2 domain-containing protein n=1 Tax=Nippostrongylus brasiliensis TaxID=27835 RepID=A0A0N4YEP4_NIPBR|nr:unnamed protein product [Nippostrongylus brasiliensis]